MFMSMDSLFSRYPSPPLHGYMWLRVLEGRTDSLVAVKHQLGFLGYLPHPHRAIPSSCGHATLAAQAVQSRDGVLMTKSAAKQKLW